MFFKSRKVQDGDILVVTFPGFIKAEAALNIKQSIRRQFPDNRVVVLGDGGDMKIVRPS